MTEWQKYMTHKEKCNGEKFELMPCCDGFQVVYWLNGTTDMRIFKKRIYKTGYKAFDAIIKRFPDTKLNQLIF